MKIALAQQNYIVGDIAGYKAKIMAGIAQAKSEGAQLIVFPELAICGYPPQDLLTYESFVKDCALAIDEIAKSSFDIAVILGGPSFNENKNGKSLFNTAFFIQNGMVKQKINKSLLPTYDIFDEYRYFEPAAETQIVEVNGHKIALTICEDLWAQADEALYIQNPMKQLMLHEPELLINIAASPFSYHHQTDRKNVLVRNASKYK